MVSSLWKSESAVAYNSFYLPNIVYSMRAATPLTNECEEIQRPVINAIHPKMDINRKAPRSIVFGTVLSSGLGLDHLEKLQCHSRL
jgi:hypothetical protein